LQKITIEVYQNYSIKKWDHDSYKKPKEEIGAISPDAADFRGDAEIKMSC